MQNSEFLTKMKSIPGPDSKYYNEFWDNERHKAEYGLTVDGVNISGWLYWHTQLWNIYQDIKDPNQPDFIRRKFMNANFRDNEWIIADGLAQARAEKKGIMIFGSRRLGKSEFLASHIGHSATLNEGSENVVTGGNWGDIDVIMYKVTQGLNALPDYFKFGRLGENLRKEIELGFKKKSGERISYSKIICRNHEEGIKTEAVAGLTASTFVMDEVGKSPFAQVFEAARPAFTSEYGWRVVPVLTGTSGDIKKSSDAEKYFLNPEAYNFITRELKEEGGKKVSLFISGLRRMEGKYDTTLANYVQKESGILVPKDSELHTIHFQDSDFHLAETVIDKEREMAAKSPDPTALLKATMYYPKNTKELFLSDDGNNFPIEAINEQIAYLLANPELQGQEARLYRDINNKPKISYVTNKKALNDYPIKLGELIEKDAAVVIYEPPMDNPPTYLYIAGADPYNHSSSKYSSSIGSFYIYKRIYDPIEGTFQRRIVASYNARPDNLKTFHETIEILLELYNAKCLPESEAPRFIQYFDLKHKSHYLADGYDFLKEISPNTSISRSRTKGLPATPKVQAYYKELVYQYLTEEIILGTNPETGEQIKKLGVIRITDIGLLRELAAFTSDGNYDRYVAFGHTLAHEAWADKIYPFTDRRVKKVEESTKEKKQPTIRINQPFSKSPFSPFTNTLKPKKGIW